MDRITSMTAFAAVVTSGSFAAAAQRLSMSPATVTNHLQSLEERLGVRLLNRTTRKLSLTEAGRAYFDQCGLILAQIEAADSSIAELNAMPRGTLRLNAANVLSYSMAPLIGGFCAAYPDITVDLTTTDRMVDLVEERIDVAIRFNQPPDSSVIVRRLGYFRVMLYAAPAYLEQHGAPRHPSELSQHNCIAYMHPGFDALTREWTLKSLAGDMTVSISGNLHTNSVEMLMAAAFDGRGIVMALSCVADAAVRSGRLARVLPDHHLGEFPIIALYPHRQHVPAKVRSFIDFAAKHFAEGQSYRASDAGSYDAAPRREPVRRASAS
ncbi:MAG TPA: LysR substrate-binding domain-containing protein [Stellaceae bacterium]